MKLIIYNKENYSKYFIYNYLPRYLVNIVEESYKSIKAVKFNKELKINTLSVFKYAMKNISISEINDTYVISINKNLNYKTYNLKSLIDYITYGNMEIKGYRLLYNIFKWLSNNIDLVYKEWLDNSY